MKLYITIFRIFLFCFPVLKQSAFGELEKSNYICTTYNCLVENPTEFADKHVRVVGVLCVFEADHRFELYLYESKEKCTAGLLGEELDIEFEKGALGDLDNLKKYHNKYVEIWGEYFGKRSENDIIVGNYLGVIRRVVRIVCLE